MESNTISTYQNILEQFKHLQVDIDYSRYLTNKSNCVIIIDGKQNFTHWCEQLKKNINAIHRTSLDLDDAISQESNHDEPLDQLEIAIDELIQLHTEITESCAHDSDLMEGRYLIEHAIGSYLDQISLHINEFRYQLNQLVFDCDDDCKSQQGKLATPVIPIALTEEIEMKAFMRWLT